MFEVNAAQRQVLRFPQLLRPHASRRRRPLELQLQIVQLELQLQIVQRIPLLPAPQEDPPLYLQLGTLATWHIASCTRLPEP